VKLNPTKIKYNLLRLKTSLQIFNFSHSKFITSEKIIHRVRLPTKSPLINMAVTRVKISAYLSIPAHMALQTTISNLSKKNKLLRPVLIRLISTLMTGSPLMIFWKNWDKLARQQLPSWAHNFHHHLKNLRKTTKIMSHQSANRIAMNQCPLPDSSTVMKLYLLPKAATILTIKVFSTTSKNNLCTVKIFQITLKIRLKMMMNLDEMQWATSLSHNSHLLIKLQKINK
jgi:hypothetical protein